MGGPADWWLSTLAFEGSGDNEGTYVQEFINDIGGYFGLPPGQGNPLDFQIHNARYTVRRGIWTKTGPKTYKTRAQGYVVQRIEMYGTYFDIVALVCLDNLTITLKDCNTAEIIEETTPYFMPGAEDPFYTFSTAAEGPVPIKRLLMSQDYPFQQ